MYINYNIVSQIRLELVKSLVWILSFFLGTSHNNTRAWSILCGRTIGEKIGYFNAGGRPLLGGVALRDYLYNIVYLVFFIKLKCRDSHKNLNDELIINNIIKMGRKKPPQVPPGTKMEYDWVKFRANIITGTYRACFGNVYDLAMYSNVVYLDFVVGKEGTLIKLGEDSEIKLLVISPPKNNQSFSSVSSLDHLLFASAAVLFYVF